MVTSLIVSRLWFTSRDISGSPLQIGEGITRRAMMLIIESGFLYLLFQLIFVVLFAIQNPAEAILAVMAVQIYVSSSFAHSKLPPNMSMTSPYRRGSLPHLSSYASVLVFLPSRPRERPCPQTSSGLCAAVKIWVHLQRVIPMDWPPIPTMKG